MDKHWYYYTLAMSVGISILFAKYMPSVISDQNIFLKDFINHEFLNIQGVILAITLASAGQLHLSLNNIEEKRGKRIFTKTRKGIFAAIYFLIGIFIFSLFLVLVKGVPELAIYSHWFNAAALSATIWYVLLLLSLTEAVMAIKPNL